MRSSLVKRLEAVEAKGGGGRKKHPYEMTDQELWEALDIRNPVTGALRKEADVSDHELEAMIRRTQAKMVMEADGCARGGRSANFIGPVRSNSIT
jgi:hypothetical protein